MYESLALSDNGFLFDTRSGNTFSLSPSGTFILRSLIAGEAPEDLANRVTATYDVDLEAAHRDVDQFLARLRDLRLLDTVGGDA